MFYNKKLNTVNLNTNLHTAATECLNIGRGHSTYIRRAVYCIIQFPVC